MRMMIDMAVLCVLWLYAKVQARLVAGIAVYTVELRFEKILFHVYSGVGSSFELSRRDFRHFFSNGETT